MLGVSGLRLGWKVIQRAGGPAIPRPVFEELPKPRQNHRNARLSVHPQSYPESTQTVLTRRLTGLSRTHGHPGFPGQDRPLKSAPSCFLSLPLAALRDETTPRRSMPLWPDRWWSRRDRPILPTSPGRSRGEGSFSCIPRPARSTRSPPPFRTTGSGTSGPERPPGHAPQNSPPPHRPVSVIGPIPPTS